MKIISSQPFSCGKNGKPQPPLPPQGVDANRSDDTLSLKISCRNAARTIEGGEISPLRSAPLHSVPLRSTTVEMTEGAGRLFYNLRPKGATTTLSGRAAVAP